MAWQGSPLVSEKEKKNTAECQLKSKKFDPADRFQYPASNFQIYMLHVAFLSVTFFFWPLNMGEGENNER